jgi:hypothetical protein
MMRGERSSFQHRSGSLNNHDQPGQENPHESCTPIVRDEFNLVDWPGHLFLNALTATMMLLVLSAARALAAPYPGPTTLCIDSAAGPGVPADSIVEGNISVPRTADVS